MAKKNARDSAAQGAAPPVAKTIDNSKSASTLQTDDSAVAYIPKTGNATVDDFSHNLVNYYMKETPQRTKLLDVFLVFLLAVGGIQFLYCVLAGNFPFNAFLAGFSATVGQFVLTISLRVQTSTSAKSEFPNVSPERAFADYVVCSLILHFFCINFIN